MGYFRKTRSRAVALIACGLLVGCAQVGAASMAARRGDAGSQFAIGNPAAYAPDPKTDPEGAAAMQKANRCAEAANRIRQKVFATTQAMGIASSVAGLAGPAGAVATGVAQFGVNMAQREAMTQTRNSMIAECM